ncbi:preprotein translocase subunit YajC [Kangiella sp. HZ709]|uniref:preprotein translocase subunit YajC n=1 Tax=Kangiella sp. HZ709 TaxID=2666328 RepID=UPI0012AFDB18|nr:preprotein translocase subunit YajC [Kangiella sp. HZ709]MRX27011.1 preprotein translocase subunit YajC [Kangiella sp. HZ709]
MFLATAAPQGGGLMQFFIMFVPLLLIMYFMMIRPQQKKMKQHQAMTAGLEKGDEVMTTGGIVGRIAKIHDQFIVLTISEGVEIKFQKSSIAQTLPKGTIKDIEA